MVSTLLPSGKDLSRQGTVALGVGVGRGQKKNGYVSKEKVKGLGDLAG